MKCIATLLTIGIILLSGCAPTSKKGTSNNESHVHAIDNPEVVELTKSILKDKLTKNGPYLLCTQEGYLKCMKTRVNFCILDQFKFNDDCTEYTMAFFGKTLEENYFETLIGIYTECMITRHQMKKIRGLKFGELEKLDTCISEIKIDEKSFVRTFWD